MTPSTVRGVWHSAILYPLSSILVAGLRARQHQRYGFRVGEGEGEGVTLVGGVARVIGGRVGVTRGGGVGLVASGLQFTAASRCEE